MRVAWDARLLFRPRLRGIGNYAQGLLTGFSRLDNRPEIVLLHDTATNGQAFQVRSVGLGPEWSYRLQLWERLKLPLGAFALGADLVHSIANTTPPHSAVPRVVTVHDVIPFLPELGEPGPDLPYFKHAVPSAVRRARVVITDSEASASDLVRVFGVSADRISVVPLAAPEELRAPASSVVQSDVLRAAGVHGPYVLALGASAPRKNTVGILRVFSGILKRCPDLSLVLTGVDDALRTKLVAAIDEFDIPSDKVVLLGFVDKNQLACLYASCAVFLFLSFYEGFGLPILEAMRCGAPVVTSPAGSCAEVAGQAAVVVEPRDEGAVIEAVEHVVNSPSFRSALIAAGLAREKEFTWLNTARLTLEAYQRAA